MINLWKTTLKNLISKLEMNNFLDNEDLRIQETGRIVLYPNIRMSQTQKTR